MPIPSAAGHPQNSGVMVPEIWSGKILEKFYARCVAAAMCNTDYEGEVKDQGDTVIVRTTPDVKINDYVKGQPLQVQHPQPDVIELRIERAKYWNVQIDDIDKFQSDIAWLDKWSNDAAQQLKTEWDAEFLGDIFADAAPYNRGTNAGKDSGDIDLGASGASAISIGNGTGDVSPVAFLLMVSQVMDETNTPDEDRTIAVPPWFLTRLKNSDIKDASLTGDPKSPIRNGRVGMVDRLEVFGSNLLPTEIQGGTRCWNVTATHRSAVSYVAQLTKNEILDKLENTFGSRARGLAVADWKVMKPDQVVTACIKPGAI